MYEIERRFLFNKKMANLIENFYATSGGMIIDQGYLSTDPERVVRVRLCTPFYAKEGAESATITIKGKKEKAKGFEFEYDIPIEDAALILDSPMVKNVITKHRTKTVVGGKTWEIDVFEHDNEGLIIAEIELNSVDEEFIMPKWVGKEITDDHRYSNSNLSLNPFKLNRESYI
jgi:adenylate cyclase